MSRSRKKPFWTQGYKGRWRKTAKRLANKRVKASDHVSDGNAYKKHYESWTICDWSFYTPNDTKSRRK